ncbi:hypothetical protein EYF80_011082 [Liparis tanakae]|uniref:Uncharacterized protein n=1 Tax=Liparis tanakae TaxID=230148 RepID=A0A4Z2ILS6_9TELE|nr:hypothetical protein EYF80_011082 [Liparis tanakae]
MAACSFLSTTESAFAIWRTEDDSLVTGQVLQDDRQVDDVVAHHVLVLGREDLLVDDLDWKDSERKKERNSNHNLSEVCTFILLATRCLFITFTVKWTGSPAIGTFPRSKSTTMPEPETRT